MCKLGQRLNIEKQEKKSEGVFIPADGVTPIEVGTPVAVHWNAHKNIWSIVELKSRLTTGRVLGYATQVTLEDCYTKIDKAKQKKVREHGAKDRHAFICGKFVNVQSEQFEKKIFYRPQDVDNFVDAEKYFKHGEVEFIEHVKRVNLDFNWDTMKPSVTYNECNPCSCDEKERKFFQDHGCCEWCYFVGEEA